MAHLLALPDGDAMTPTSKTPAVAVAPRSATAGTNLRFAGEPSGVDPEPSESLQEGAAGTAAPAAARLAGGTDRRRIGNRYGTRRRGNYSSFEELLAESIAVDDNGCWIWLRKINHKGYGQIHATKDRPMGQAHRFVWENLRGPIPKGLQLDHLCRVKPCVNPDHLEPVTNAENARRANVLRVRQTVVRPLADPTRCRNGHPLTDSTRDTWADGYSRCLTCNRERRQREAAARRERRVTAHQARSDSPAEARTGEGLACPTAGESASDEWSG